MDSNPSPDKELIATLTPEALSKLGLSPEQLTAETPATVWGPKTLQHPNSPVLVFNSLHLAWINRQRVEAMLAQQMRRQHPEVLGLEPGSMPALEATLDKMCRAMAQCSSPVVLGHPLL